jgi:hypothetical protein
MHAPPESEGLGGISFSDTNSPIKVEISDVRLSFPVHNLRHGGSSPARAMTIELCLWPFDRTDDGWMEEVVMVVARHGWMT